jgi:geranylgeranyl diphosphate synthase type I
MGATGTVSSMVGKHDALPDSFDRFVEQVRALVEAWLSPWLEARVAEASARGPEVAVVAEALRQLVVRGGKRMRAVLLASAYIACGGEEVSSVVPAAAGLELLQAYLLTHDDWMDGDEVRRGGPSVPAALRVHFAGRAHGPSSADAASILAGDLAAAWALSAILELKLAPARVVGALRELGGVEQEVVHGQLLDVCAEERSEATVAEIYALKTASYTVRGPVVMGAMLAGAGADDARARALVEYAEPLGIGFQLRDDLLGAFGDPRATGKPLGGDLRKGKRTALVVEAMRDPLAAAAIGRILGQTEASEPDLAGALRALEASGARARVEGRISALALESRAALEKVPLVPFGRGLLAQAIVALTERDR